MRKLCTAYNFFRPTQQPTEPEITTTIATTVTDVEVTTAEQVVVTDPEVTTPEPEIVEETTAAE